MSRNLQARMHPAVAGSFESTPEHAAILHREDAPYLPFGHLVTKLVDEGIVYPTSPETVREQVGLLFGMEGDHVKYWMEQSTDLPVNTRKAYTERARVAFEGLFVDAATAMARQRVDEIIVDTEIDTDAEGYQELLDYQQRKVADLREQNRFGNACRLDVACHQLRELEQEPWAIKVKDFSHLAEELGADLGSESCGWYISEINALVADAVVMDDPEIPVWEQDLTPENVVFQAVAGADVVQALPRAYASALKVEPEVKKVIKSRVETIEDIMFVPDIVRMKFHRVYPSQ